MTLATRIAILYACGLGLALARCGNEIKMTPMDLPLTHAANGDEDAYAAPQPEDEFARGPEPWPTSPMGEEAIRLHTRQQSSLVDLLDFAVHEDDRPGLSASELAQLLGPQDSQQPWPCKGAFTYLMYDCFREARSPHCGVEADELLEEVVEYNGCALPQFGQSGMAAAEDGVRDDAYYEVIEKNWCKKDGRDLDKLDHITSVTRLCTEHLQKMMREAGQDGHTGQCFDLVRKADASKKGNKNCYFGGKNTFVMWSAHVRTMHPVFNYRDSDPACGRKTPVQMRTVRARSFNACRHSAFGREATNVCGAPERRVFSQTGIFSRWLKHDHFYFRPAAIKEALCTTCDVLTFPAGDAARAKVQCYKDVLHLAQQMHDGSTQESIEPGHAPTAQQLFEQVQTRAKAFFEASDVDSVHSTDFLPFYAAGLGSDQGEQDSQHAERISARRVLGLCAGLLQEHANKERIVAEYSGCLAAAAVPELDAKERQNAARLALRLFGRYVRTMHTAPAHVKAEAANAAFLMQAWSNFALVHLPPTNVEEVENIRQMMQGYVDQKINGLL